MHFSSYPGISESCVTNDRSSVFAWARRSISAISALSASKSVGDLNFPFAIPIRFSISVSWTRVICATGFLFRAIVIAFCSLDSSMRISFEKFVFASRILIYMACPSIPPLKDQAGLFFIPLNWDGKENNKQK